MLGRAGFLRLSWRRDDTQLRHHAQQVSLAPVLYDLALHYPIDVYPRDLYTVAGRRNAQELALVGAAEVKRVTTLSPSAIWSSTVLW